MDFPIITHGYESWAVKKAEHWRTDAFKLEKTLENPFNSKEIKPVNPKGNQPWIFIGRTVAEAKAPILWPPDVNSQLIGKDPDAKNDWGQEEKGVTEDEIDGWMASPTQWTWVWANSEMVKDRESWCAEVHGVAKRHNWATEQQYLELLNYDHHTHPF